MTKKTIEIVPVTGWIKVLISTFKDNIIDDIKEFWFPEGSKTGKELLKGVK